MNTLLSLGHGYSSAALAARLIPLGWRVIGTTRTVARMDALQASGVEPLFYPCDLADALSQASHVLAAAAPDGSGDPFLNSQFAAFKAAHPKWVGYLSTTAVYGDHQGAWVNEETPVAPQSARAVQRILAERQWLGTGLPVHIFRLAGIYGPGRGPFEKVRDGSARRIIKAGQVFSRIHVDDIAGTLLASINAPDPGRVYNVCDDDPAPPEDVLAYAAALLGLPEPPAVPYEAAEMSPMARSFYGESKKVSNHRIRSELGVDLMHPTYRDGLAALLAQGQ